MLRGSSGGSGGDDEATGRVFGPAGPSASGNGACAAHRNRIFLLSSFQFHSCCTDQITEVQKGGGIGPKTPTKGVKWGAHCWVDPGLGMVHSRPGECEVWGCG